MKITKYITAIILCLCMISYAHAQELKTEMAKPLVAPATPETKPSPDLSGNKTTTELPVLKQSTEQAVVTDPKDNEQKLQRVPENKVVANRESSIAPGKRTDAVRPVPMIPAHSTAAPAPAQAEKAPAKKTPAARQQPVQQQ